MRQDRHFGEIQTGHRRSASIRSIPKYLLQDFLLNQASQKQRLVGGRSYRTRRKGRVGIVWRRQGGTRMIPGTGYSWRGGSKKRIRLLSSGSVCDVAEISGGLDAKLYRMGAPIRHSSQRSMSQLLRRAQPVSLQFRPLRFFTAGIPARLAISLFPAWCHLFLGFPCCCL